MDASQHIKTVAARFSKAAPVYDSYAQIQKEAATRLIELTSRTESTPSVLEIGCGTGQLTRLIRNCWPHARITAVDISKGMIQEAQTLHADDSQITWLHTNIMSLRPADKYPLVISNCALHWLLPFHESLQHVSLHLAPGGYLAAAIVEDGTLRELNEARLKAAPHKPPLGSLPSHEGIIASFANSGLKLEHATRETHVTSSPGADSLLKALHNQGLTGGMVSRAKIPLNRSEFIALRSYYDTHFRLDDGSVSASYAIGYFLARKNP